MRKTGWGTTVAIAAVSLVVMAACGSDKKTTSTTAAAATTTAAAAAASTAPASGTSSNGTSAPSSGSTATTVAAGTTAASSTAPATDAAGSYGLINGIYKGAGGFTIDPKKECPADWNPKQGITDTDINLFISLATAGPLAGFGLIADGMKSYYKYINDNGGIGGRKINLDVKDDGYQPAQTKSNVDEALGANKYAAFDAMLGTPNGLATWDTYNDECMPGLYTASGAAQWGDVENHPWTVGLGLNYFTEAGLWETWLAKEHPDLTNVVEITYNNDFGQTYHQGFAHAIQGTNIKVLDQETHEATTPNLTNQFTTLAATNAQVLLLETTGAFCTQAMAEVEKQTTWHPLVIMSATCASLNQFFKPLIDQGLTGNGTYLIQSGIDVLDPINATNPLVALYNKVLPEQGLDPKVTTYATGWAYAWFTVEALKLATTYQGGIDRGNILLAARGLREPFPFNVPGVTSIMDGLKDAYPIEGGQMTQYTVTDPKQIGKLVKVGDLVNLEGQLGTYATVKNAIGATSASTTAAPTTTG
jgi:branched-chain amino acid transport system substrate-binding protein